MTEISTVAVLGTGIMGAPVARNLAAAGFEVHAWNRTREKADALAGERISVWDQSAGAVDEADAVITLLPDADAVHDAMSGLSGALYSMKHDAIWIQMSTIGVDATAEMIELADRAQIGFVDAPAIGTRVSAEEGRLTVLASGDIRLLDLCEPILEPLTTRIVRLPRAGDGARMKLVVNNWVLALTSGIAESIALARALDVDPSAFLEIISGGPIDARYAQAKGEAMIAGEYETKMPLRHAGKDARLVIEAAQNQGLHLAFTRAIAGRFAEADRAGFGDEDMAAIFRAIERGGAPQHEPD